MNTSRFFSTIFLFTCIWGIFATGVRAGGPTYGISIDSIAANCTSTEVTVVYGFDNFDGGEGTSEVITITVKTSGGDIVNTDSEPTTVQFEPMDPLQITLPLASPLKPGETYTLILQLNNGEKAVQTFTACSGTSTSETSSKPVELPPCKLNDERLDETCASPIVVYSQAREDGCYVSIYSKYGRADGKTVLLLQAIPAEIGAAQAQEGNAVIDSVEVVNLGTVTIYWLPATNEFQINAGPNEEGKVYVLNFTGCPATNVYSSNSFQKAQ